MAVWRSIALYRYTLHPCPFPIRLIPRMHPPRQRWPYTTRGTKTLQRTGEGELLSNSRPGHLLCCRREEESRLWTLENRSHHLHLSALAARLQEEIKGVAFRNQHVQSVVGFKRVRACTICAERKEEHYDVDMLCMFTVHVERQLQVPLLNPAMESVSPPRISPHRREHYESLWNVLGASKKWWQG